jgi:hypothetical protein
MLANLFMLFSSLKAWGCSRYDQAYPNIINNDNRLGDPASRTFQFESCSGAVVSDVVKDQIPRISANQQVILLSAGNYMLMLPGINRTDMSVLGGNDAELSNLLNQCIFQWAALTQDQVPLAKIALADSEFAWVDAIDLDRIGLGCDKQLERTKQIIAGDAFSKSLDTVIKAAKLKLAAGSVTTVFLYF